MLQTILELVLGSKNVETFPFSLMELPAHPVVNIMTISGSDIHVLITCNLIPI